MAELLERVAIDSADLWRAHPPKIHHRQKQVLFDLAGGLSRVPSGPLVISRWAPSAARAIGPQVPTESIEGPFTYPREREAWHVNFADTELFAFYGGSAFAQDEIQVAEHPLLASVRGLLTSQPPGSALRALTREPSRPTPVLVRHVERWCAIDTDPELAMPYGIYGTRLSRAKSDALSQAVTRIDPPSRSHILAMVAPQGRGRYSREQIGDILTTAITGFEAALAELPGAGIHTGHWGTGAFGGHRVLMAAAQLLAARAVGLPFLAYHSLDDDGAVAFAKGAAVADAVAEGTSVEACIDILDTKAFMWGASDGN